MFVLPPVCETCYAFETLPAGRTPPECETPLVSFPGSCASLGTRLETPPECETPDCEIPPACKSNCPECETS